MFDLTVGNFIDVTSAAKKLGLLCRPVGEIGEGYNPVTWSHYPPRPTPIWYGNYALATMDKTWEIVTCAQVDAEIGRRVDTPF